jgi:hypothetical protein
MRVYVCLKVCLFPMTARVSVMTFRAACFAACRFLAVHSIAQQPERYTCCASIWDPAASMPSSLVITTHGLSAA